LLDALERGILLSFKPELFITFSLLLQLMVWSLDGWKKQAGTFLKNPAGRVSKPLSQTRIKFQKDEIHLLVIHDTQLAIYEASKLKCIEQVSLTFLSSFIVFETLNIYDVSVLRFLACLYFDFQGMLQLYY
jgi:hypothetical protein